MADRIASCTFSGTQLYTPWQMMKSNCPSAARSMRCDIALQQLHVAKAQCLHAQASLVDLHLRQIDAHSARLRMPRGERDQVASGGTADFQHPRARHLGRVQPEQVGDRRQLARCRLRKRMRVVRRRVVVGAQPVNQVIHCPAPNRHAGNVGHSRASPDRSLPCAPDIRVHVMTGCQPPFRIRPPRRCDVGIGRNRAPGSLSAPLNEPGFCLAAVARLRLSNTVAHLAAK